MVLPSATFLGVPQKSWLFQSGLIWCRTRPTTETETETQVEARLNSSTSVRVGPVLADPF